jgi:hypothetical protein
MIKKIFPFIVLGMMVSCGGPTSNNVNSDEVINDYGPEENGVYELYRTMDGRILYKEEYQKYSDSIDIVLEKYRKEFDSKEIDY